MVCIYKNGLDFINDNQDILNNDPINLAFYVIDARIINSFDKNGFIFKCYDENRYLLVLYLNPMNLMLYGDCSLCNEVCLVLNKYGFDFNGVLAESNLGECFLLEYERLFGGRHKVHLSMSIMKCNYVDYCDCSDVEFSKDKDLFEIYGLFKMFAVVDVFAQNNLCIHSYTGFVKFIHKAVYFRRSRIFHHKNTQFRLNGVNRNIYRRNFHLFYSVNLMP